MIPNEEHDGTKNTDKHIKHRSQLIFVPFLVQRTRERERAHDKDSSAAVFEMKKDALCAAECALIK